MCRSRAARSAQCNDDAPIERLEGLILVVEDWHARLTLTRVCYINLHMLNIIRVLRCYGYWLPYILVA